MAEWSLLTNHARVLVCIAEEPTARFSDIAARLSITERRAFAIIHELADAGCVVVLKEGRRNRYVIQGATPLDEGLNRQLTIGQFLGNLAKDLRT